MKDVMKDHVAETDHVVVPSDDGVLSLEFARKVTELPGMRRLYIHDGFDGYSLHTYANDPSAFLPEGMKAITVAQAKQDFLQVLAWDDRLIRLTSELPDIDTFIAMEPSDQAQALNAFLMNNEECFEQAVDHAVRRHVLLAVTCGEGYAPINRGMSLIGYMGHYLGEENAETFIRALDFTQEGADFDLSQYGMIQQKIAQSDQVFSRLDDAIQTIAHTLVTETPDLPTALQGIVSAAYEMELNSDAVHHLAHRSQFNSNQYDAQQQTQGSPTIKR